MTIISALERQSHEDHGFEDSLGYRVKPCLKKKKDTCISIKEIHIKTTMRYRCTYSRMAITKEMTLIRVTRMWGGPKPCWWVCKMQ
jgi:hypothetical protein